VSISSVDIPAVRMESPRQSALVAAGDQFPLKIVMPEIKQLMITQSTSRPGARNTITVTLQTNAPIQPNRGSSLTISGLHGAQAPKGLMTLKNIFCVETATAASPPTDSVPADKASCEAITDLSGATACNAVKRDCSEAVTGTSVCRAGCEFGTNTDAAKCFYTAGPSACTYKEQLLTAFKSSEDGVPGAGSWCSDTKTLTVFFSETLDHLSPYAFSFDVLNPTCNQVCSNPTVVAKGLNCAPEGCGADASFIPSESTKEILAPALQKGSGDSCPMKVDAPTFIVKTISECSEIAGEVNTLSVTLVPIVPLPRGTVVSIVGLVGARVTKGAAPVSGKDAPRFSDPTWIEASSTLKLTVQSDSGFPAHYSIAFDLAVQNPRSPQQPVQPSVGADHADVIIGVSTMSGHVLSAKSARRIVAASIAESSTVAGSYNTLMMIIQTNVVVAVGSSVTISGLSGTAPAGGAAYELGGMHPSYFGPPVFDRSEATLVLSVTRAIPAHRHTMIGMEVKNDNDGRDGVSCEVAVGCPAGVQGCISLPKAGMIGKVLSFKSPAVFTTKLIGQSSPYPGETNVLSITLATNVEFRAAAGSVAKI
jgi:hypothetical protein